MSKKVLWIYSGHSHIVGGDAKYLVDILNNISLDNLSIRVFSDQQTPMRDFVERNLTADISFEYLPTFPKGRVRDLQGKMKIIDFCHKVLTGFYITSKISNFFIFFKLFASDRKNAPHVFWFNNGGYPGKEAGFWAMFAAKICGCPKIIMTVHNIPGERKWFKPFEIFYDYLSKNICDTVIVPSKNVKEALASDRGIFGAKVVYCGIPEFESSGNAAQLRDTLGIGKEVVALLTGHLDEKRKGHEIAIKACALAKRHGSSIKLVLAGKGAPEREMELKELSRHLKIERDVIFLGARSDIFELNEMADIVLVPSLGFEATPYTIKEGSRSGKPVITTNAGGCAEGVIPSITGEVVRAGDAVQLGNALARLAQNESLRKSMGAEGRVFFRQKFLLKEKIKEHEEILF